MSVAEHDDPLTFESRRLRLFAANAFTAVVFTFPAAAASLLLISAALLPAADVSRAPATGEPVAAELAGVALRGVALAGIACAIGFSIASIGRNSAAALAAGFAYIIVLENIIGGSTPRWRRWLLLGNTIVFISGSSSGSDVPGRTVTQAGLLLGAVAIVWLIGASAAFRARDLA